MRRATVGVPYSQGFWIREERNDMSEHEDQLYPETLERVKAERDLAQAFYEGQSAKSADLQEVLHVLKAKLAEAEAACAALRVGLKAKWAEAEKWAEAATAAEKRERDLEMVNSRIWAFYAELERERDRLKAKLAEVERERDDAQAFYEGQADKAADLQEVLHVVKAKLAEVVPQTFGEALHMYGIDVITGDGHEWDNHTTVENVPFLVGLLCARIAGLKLSLSAECARLAEAEQRIAELERALSDLLTGIDVHNERVAGSADIPVPRIEGPIVDAARKVLKGGA